MANTAPRLLLCTLAALALAPAAARADAEPPPIPVPAVDQLMAAAHALAAGRWGMEPCGGQVSVTWAHMGPGINARSQWMSTDVHNPATFTSCAIAYNLDVDWDWPKLCTVVEHELGHLAGHDHVDDPHNVMSPYYVFPTPECAGGQQPATPSPEPAPAPSPPRAASPAASKKASTRKAKKRKAVKRRAKTRHRRARGAKRRAHDARIVVPGKDAGGRTVLRTAHPRGRS
jgi:hypothetical protein